MIVNIGDHPYIEYHGEDEARLRIDGTIEFNGRAFSGAYSVNPQNERPPVLMAGEVVELEGGYDRFTGEFKISDLQIIEDY